MARRPASRASAVVEDVPGDPGTTAALVPGPPVAGAVDPAGDQDGFRLVPTPGTTYVIDLEGASSGAGTLPDPYLRLLDAAGIPIDGDDDSGVGLDSRLGLEATSGEVLLVSAEGLGSSVGTYRLSARELPEDVPGGPGTTATLAVGGSVEGAVDFPGDADWFGVELRAGETFRFRLEGVGGSPIPSPFLALYEADGARLTEARYLNGDSPAELGWSARESGTYYISAEGWGGYTGDYRLSVDTLPEDQPGDPGTTASLAVGGSVEGAVDFPGDADWFRVELQAGRTYVLDLADSASGAGTLEVPFVRLLDPAGTEIRSDLQSGVGADARLGFSPVVSGSYLVSAEGAYGYYTGSYRLSAREEPGDLPDNVTTPLTLRPGDRVGSEIDFAGDVDWFRIDGKAGRTYVVDVAGLATLGGTLPDPAVTVDDAGGAIHEHELEIRAAGGWNDLPGAREWRSGLVIEAETASAPGPGWSQWAVADGGNGHFYKLTDVGRNVTWGEASARATSAGGHLATITSAGENAWVSALVAAAGLEGAWIGGLQPRPETAAEPDGGWAWVTGEPFTYRNWAPRQPDNALWARDDSAAVDNDDGGAGTDAQAGFRLGGQDGPIYVQVRGDGSTIGSYSVAVREIAGEIGGDPATAAALGVGSRVGGTIDFADDRDWFRVEVTPGRTYVFDLEGAATGQGDLDRPRLGLHGPDGALVVEDYDQSGVGGNARILYTVPTGTGHVFLAARGEGQDDRGTYTLGARVDSGGAQTDLPELVEGRALPEAAIQPAGPVDGDVVVTWLGGSAGFDSAIGIVDTDDTDRLADSRLIFPSLEGLAPGASVTLEGIESGHLFLLPDGADRIKAIETLAPGALIFRNPETGDVLRPWEETAPDLLLSRDGRLDELFFDALFATDPNPYDPGNGLNPDGQAHATSGAFARAGGQTFQVVAFEDLVGAGGNHDFNDAAIALSPAPLTPEDLAAVREHLFG